MKVSAALDLLLDIVYPRCCLLCQSRLEKQPVRCVCFSCLSRLAWAAPSLCLRCGIPVEPGGSCANCTAGNFTFDSVWSLGPYQGGLRQLIHSFKFEGDRGVGRDIIRYMLRSEGLQQILAQADGIVCVPMHPLKEKNRGYNQAKVLADELASATGIGFLDKVLVKCRTSVPQVGLNKKNRWMNVAGTFAMGARGTSGAEHIVLIDDVMTTGATAHHCANLLRRMGISRIDIVVAARSLAVDDPTNISK